VRTTAHIAAGHHIWWSFPYPPPGDVVGSLQLGPNNLYRQVTGNERKEQKEKHRRKGQVMITGTES